MTSMTGFSGRTGGSSGNRSTGDIIPRGYEKGQLSQFTPEQMGLFKQLFAHLGPDSQLSRLAQGDQSQFEALEAPAKREFIGQQGQLASRFSQLAPGTLSSRGSSGFQNALGQQSSDFAQQLQAQRMGLQRQALQDLFGMSSQLFGQNPYEKFLTEKPMNFLKQLGIGLSQGVGQAAASLPFLL